MLMMMKIYDGNDDNDSYRLTGSEAVFDITLEDHLEVLTQLYIRHNDFRFLMNILMMDHCPGDDGNVSRKLMKMMIVVVLPQILSSKISFLGN